MQTVLVEIRNNKVLKLLQALEELDLIRLLKKNATIQKEKLSDKFGGKLHLTDEEYKDFQHMAVTNLWMTCHCRIILSLLKTVLVSLYIKAYYYNIFKR